MEEKILKATHYGTLKIGDTEFACAVLEDGTRILRERSIARALGKKGGGAYWQQKKKVSNKGAVLPEYISLKNLEQFIEDETREKLLNPIIYRTKSGTISQGVSATLLTEICNIWLDAREKGALSKSQELTAQKAEVLMRGFAKVGIIALVDEVTGYQYDRKKDELQQILKAYISAELLPWTKRFPNEFYEQLFRLHKWQYNPLSVKRPGYVGKLTMELIYNRLPPGVSEELKNKTPKSDAGNYIKRFHQSLTTDIGNPHLEKQLAIVTTLMKISPNWNTFKNNFNKAFGGQIELEETLELGENKNTEE